MYARCCSRLMVLRVRLIRGAPRAGVSPWVQGLRLSRRSLLRLASAPTGRTEPAPRPVGRQGVPRCFTWSSDGRCPWRQLMTPPKRPPCAMPRKKPTADGAEAQDQAEALAGRLRDPLPVRAGEDPDQAGPGAEQMQAVEHRRDERDHARAPGSPRAACPGADGACRPWRRETPAVLGRNACAMGHLLRKAAHRSAIHTRCVQIDGPPPPDFNRKPRVRVLCTVCTGVCPGHDTELPARGSPIVSGGRYRCVRITTLLPRNDRGR